MGGGFVTCRTQQVGVAAVGQQGAPPYLASNLVAVPSSSTSGSPRVHPHKSTDLRSNIGARRTRVAVSNVLLEQRRDRKRPCWPRWSGVLTVKSHECAGFSASHHAPCCTLKSENNGRGHVSLGLLTYVCVFCF